MLSLKKNLFCLLSILLISSSSLPAKEELQKYMIADLDHIKEMFAIRYAPLQWKGEYKNWDLNEEIMKAKRKLHFLASPTVKEFQRIVKALYDSAADYHVTVKFFSTESASLPFIMKGAEGRYFVVYVDRDELPLWQTPLRVGDEIISFNGKKIAEAVAEFKESDFNGGACEESEQAQAELLFTMRSGQFGYIVPQGIVEMVVKSHPQNEIKRVILKWDYIPERVAPQGRALFNAHKLGVEVDALVKREEFLKKQLVSPIWTEVTKSSFLCDEPPYFPGARTSFLPPLGPKIWGKNQNSIFDSYIFKSPQGFKVGYIRIPTYMADEEEALEFQKIISRFEKTTQALVIDQLNNPGGSLFYLYALASMLTDVPLAAPKHHIALTQAEIYEAVNILEELEEVSSDEDAQECVGMSIGGYPVDYKFIESLRSHMQFLVDEWSLGNRVTGSTSLMGVENIEPHPETRYTKPILLLINSLDFSGGDFFPAIMQDNKRALLVGTRTAGAGGYVLKSKFPNLSGIASSTLTGSLAKRPNGTLIENLGVHPDIFLDFTANDLQNDYVDYVQSLLLTLDQFIQEKYNSPQNEEETAI